MAYRYFFIFGRGGVAGGRIGFAEKEKLVAGNDAGDDQFRGRGAAFGFVQRAVAGGGGNGG